MWGLEAEGLITEGAVAWTRWEQEKDRLEGCSEAKGWTVAGSQE